MQLFVARLQQNKMLQKYILRNNKNDVYISRKWMMDGSKNLEMNATKCLFRI